MQFRGGEFSTGTTGNFESELILPGLCQTALFRTDANWEFPYLYDDPTFKQHAVWKTPPLGGPR
jgi:hypothetical protein